MSEEKIDLEEKRKKTGVVDGCCWWVSGNYFLGFRLDVFQLRVNIGGVSIARMNLGKFLTCRAETEVSLNVIRNYYRLLIAHGCITKY